MKTLHTLLLGTLISSTTLAASRPAEEFLHAKRPLVIGHRGYPLFSPENTLASFQRALEVGVDLVELDYHHSRDGVPIVIHDGTLDRTTDARARWGGEKIPVSSRTAEELLALNAGSWFKPPVATEHLTTLATALDFIQRSGVTLIERKAGDAATLAKLLHDHDLINRVVVQSFDWSFLRDYRKLDGTQVLGALGPAGSRNGRKLTDEEKALNPEWLDEIHRLGAQLAVWNSQVDAASVAAAHQRGLQVWVYTIDKVPDAQALLRAGVDGIITNNPGLLWKVVAEFVAENAGPSTDAH